MHSDRSPFRLALTVAAAPVLLLPGCAETEQEQVTNAPVAVEVQAEPPTVATAQALLDREGLILAALRAATAAALGQKDDEAQSQLKGSKFELRTRFGCSGNDAEAGSGWTYDQAKGVLRARVQADLDAAQLQANGLLSGEYEGAVGFALGNPWMLRDGCPNPKFDPRSEGPAITLVQLFTGSDSRVQRPQTSYEAITHLTPEEVPVQGLSLVIAGRLEPLSDGRPFHCAATKGRPACIVSALIDRVTIEDPARDVVLGEWGAS